MKRRFIAFGISAMLLTGCTNLVESEPESVPSTSIALITTAATTTSETTTTAATTPPPPPEDIITSVNVLCAGDNLIHSPIYSQAKNRSNDGGYDFSYAYENVADIIAAADLAILNQETIITDAFAPSTYPCFCSPEDLGAEMIKLGFDAVSISNNHVLDKGEAGLLATLDYWEAAHPDIPVYGAYRNAEDMDNIRTIMVNDISFAFLGYMEHTNGLYLPASSECELVYLDETELIKQQVKEAAKNYDCVIVSAHFGLETTNEIMQSQYDIAQQLADWGADIIIGTQPHTIQSMEYLDTIDGRQAFVYYCLGNFISAQSNPYCMVEMLGEITVTKNHTTGEVSLSDAKAIPLINHYDYGYENVRVYPFSNYTQELANVHGCEKFTYSFSEQLIKANIPEEFLVTE